MMCSPSGAYGIIMERLDKIDSALHGNSTVTITNFDNNITSLCTTSTTSHPVGKVYYWIGVLWTTRYIQSLMVSNFQVLELVLCGICGYMVMLSRK
jgi:hypothetical protein